MYRRILSDGKDITTEINQRFISLEITDESGGQSDSLRIELADDGLIQFPQRQSELQVWLGYSASQQSYKGVFTVTDVELSFPANTLVINATAASQTDKMKSPLNFTWHDLPLSTVIETIAGRNGLTAAVSDEFKNIQIQHKDQKAQSDSDFLMRLAEQFDATFKVADRQLVFFGRGDGKSVSGSPLPPVKITLDATTQGVLKLKGKNHFKSVAAQYRDFEGAEAVVVKTGDEKPQRMLSDFYTNEDETKRAVWAELHNAERKKFVLLIKKMPANPEIRAERLIEVSGHFRDEINGVWVVKSCSESQDSSGYWVRFEGSSPKA